MPARIPMANRFRAVKPRPYSEMRALLEMLTRCVERVAQEGMKLLQLWEINPIFPYLDGYSIQCAEYLYITNYYGEDY